MHEPQKRPVAETRQEQQIQRLTADLTARNRRYRRLNRRAATGILAGTAIALAGAWLGSDDVALAGFLVTFATVATTITVDIVWARRDAADPVWRHAPGFSPRQYHFYGTCESEQHADGAHEEAAGLIAARATAGGEHRPAKMVEPDARDARMIDELAQADEDEADAEHRAAIVSRDTETDREHKAGRNGQLVPLVERLSRSDPAHSATPRLRFLRSQ